MMCYVYNIYNQMLFDTGCCVRGDLFVADCI